MFPFSWGRPFVVTLMSPCGDRICQKRSSFHPFSGIGLAANNYETISYSCSELWGQHIFVFWRFLMDLLHLSNYQLFSFRSPGFSLSSWSLFSCFATITCGLICICLGVQICFWGGGGGVGCWDIQPKLLFNPKNLSSLKKCSWFSSSFPLELLRGYTRQSPSPPNLPVAFSTLSLSTFFLLLPLKYAFHSVSPSLAF